MAIIAGPEGSIARGGPLAVIPPQYVYTSTVGDGGFDFQKLLNQLGTGAQRSSIKAARGLGNILNMPGAGMALPAVYGAGSIMGGNVLGGVGEIAGGATGAGLSGGLAKAAEQAVGKMGAKGRLLAPIAGGAVRLAGGLLGGAIGGGLGQAAQAVTGGAAQTQMGRGESPGIIPGIGGKGIGFTDEDVKRIQELSRITGQSQVDIARQMLPLSNQFRDAEMQRQMQLNQQTGQITGALNRQLYTAQLAAGAQAQAGETTRTMMTAANPYAASAFQYRGG